MTAREFGRTISKRSSGRPFWSRAETFSSLVELRIDCSERLTRVPAIRCGASRCPLGQSAFQRHSRSMGKNMSQSLRAGTLTLEAFKTASTRFRGRSPTCLRQAPSWFSSFVKRARPLRTCPDTRGDPGGTALPRSQWTIYVPEQLMKNDFQHRAEVAASLTSRRKFIGAAVAIGGAGMVSAELGILSARGTAGTAAQSVLPAATKDVTPFKVSVPQSAIDDLKRRLASTRWPERETVGDWSQGDPLQKAPALDAYWPDMHDWRRFEARINAFPQYRTQ